MLDATALQQFQTQQSQTAPESQISFPFLKQEVRMEREELRVGEGGRGERERKKNCTHLSNQSRKSKVNALKNVWRQGSNHNQTSNLPCRTKQGRDLLTDIHYLLIACGDAVKDSGNQLV